MYSLNVRLWGLTLSLLLLAACSGGGKGGNPPTANTPVDTIVDTTPPADTSPAPDHSFTDEEKLINDPNIPINPAPLPTPITSAATSQYVVVALPSKTRIILLDTDNPANVKYVTSPTEKWGNLELIPFGTYSADSISDMHFRSALFTLNGKIYAVSLLKNETNTSKQISNEIDATRFCSSLLNPDFFNHSNTAFLYELAGADGDCKTPGDNIWKMVRLNMNDTEAPIPAARPILALDDVATGAAGTGWLAQTGNELLRYDANFSNGVIIKSGISTASPLSAARDFIIIDNKLYYYDQATKALSNVLHDFTTNKIGRMNLSDGIFDYFYEQTEQATVQTKLFRIRSDGTSVSQLLSNENGLLKEYALTTNRLFYTVVDSSSSSFEFKTLRNVEPFDPSNIALNRLPVNLAARGNRLYFNMAPQDAGDTHHAAILNDVTGVLKTAQNSRWVGLTLTTSISQIAAASEVVSHLILMSGYDSTQSKFINATLSSYNAVDGTLVVKLGTVPTNLDSLSFTPEFGLSTVGHASSGDRMDFYFIPNLTTANSLRRMTTYIP